MSSTIVPIVEGYSETESVPVLLRRLRDELARASTVEIARPYRISRYGAVRPGALERAVEQAARDRPGAAAVLVILDADDDCPAVLGPELQRRAAGATGLPVSVVLANREFKGWFLGAKESLRTKRGISQDACAPPDPEAIRGAKERLSDNMVGGRRYLEVDDQPAFAAMMDLRQARAHCPSFDKLCREIERLVQAIEGH